MMSRKKVYAAIFADRTHLLLKNAETALIEQDYVDDPEVTKQINNTMSEIAKLHVLARTKFENQFHLPEPV